MVPWRPNGAALTDVALVKVAPATKRMLYTCEVRILSASLCCEGGFDDLEKERLFICFRCKDTGKLFTIILIQCYTLVRKESARARSHSSNTHPQPQNTWQRIGVIVMDGMGMASERNSMSRLVLFRSVVLRAWWCRTEEVEWGSMVRGTTSGK